MFMVIYEILSVFLLLIAGVTGIMALRSLKTRQKTYKLSRIFKSELPYYKNPDLRRFLLCFVLMFSTAGAFLATFLRVTWLNDIGWDFSQHEWAYWWMTSHTIDGFSFTGVHLLVYMRQKRLDA